MVGPAAPNCNTLLDSAVTVYPRSLNFFVRGPHTLLHNVRGLDIICNVIVLGYVAFSSINKIFKNINFFIIDDMHFHP